MSGTELRYVPPLGEGAVASVTAGLQINVDNTDPTNPVVATDSSAHGVGKLVETIVAGSNITVDDTDPVNPIVSATGGGGGTVTSVVAGDQIAVNATDPANPVVSTHNGTTGNDGELVEQLQAGTGISIDNTDPKKPVVTNTAVNSLTENVITAAGYTLVLTDAGKVVSLSNASNQTLTIPANGTVAFPTGTVIYLNNLGAGLWTVAAAGGVTLGSPYSKVQLATQYAQATLWKRDTNTWQLEGNLA